MCLFLVIFKYIFISFIVIYGCGWSTIQQAGYLIRFINLVLRFFFSKVFFKVISVIIWEVTVLVILLFYLIYTDLSFSAGSFFLFFSERLCAFCYCGGRSLLGQGQLCAFSISSQLDACSDGDGAVPQKRVNTSGEREPLK